MVFFLFRAQTPDTSFRLVMKNYLFYKQLIKASWSACVYCTNWLNVHSAHQRPHRASAYVIAFVSAADNEIIQTVGGIYLHDMPQDRLAADLNQGFWPIVGFFGEPRPYTTCEDNSFHPN